MSDLQYPVGQYVMPTPITPDVRRQWIQEIAETPDRLRAAVEGLSAQQLDTPYRPGGWTVRQVVHHLPDSHLNAYVRFKLALTEEAPTIKPYMEERWAELEDARTAPPEVSVALLISIHRRWVLCLKSLVDTDFARTFHHPELGVRTLDATLGLYAWHGRHHIAHVTSLRRRMGWVASPGVSHA